ncbi:hypothetical protein LZ30DRAFT_236809 [Colletotrichum cereale]|nr:hypothetical protein LZ30DRAFT_236809 [Colletotrichum cereale]
MQVSIPLPCNPKKNRPKRNETERGQRGRGKVKPDNEEKEDRTLAEKKKKKEKTGNGTFLTLSLLRPRSIPYTARNHDLRNHKNHGWRNSGIACAITVLHPLFSNKPLIVPSCLLMSKTHSVVCVLLREGFRRIWRGKDRRPAREQRPLTLGILTAVKDTLFVLG